MAIGDTFPTVTFWTRAQEVQSTIDNRLIKDGEIPPNDALIMVDGRVVLEKTQSLLIVLIFKELNKMLVSLLMFSMMNHLEF